MKLFYFLFFYSLIHSITIDAMFIKHRMKYPFYKQSNFHIPRGKKIVLVGGCFDTLHYGHILFLEKARNCGDHLIVALEPDERITKHKNRNPMHNQNERAHNLSALRSVDGIIMLPLLNGFSDYCELVRTINPHVIAITSNDPQLENKQRQADAIGAELTIVTHRIEPFSSSAIYRKEIERACE